MMGEAVAHYLLNKHNTKQITLIDINEEALISTKLRLQDERIKIKQLDASNFIDTYNILKDKDVVISTANYELNENITEAAISSETHMIDAGGNNNVVKKQFLLDQFAKNAKVKILPDFGVAPGAVSVLSKYLIDKYGLPEKLKILVGGLPKIPKNKLEYELVFGVHGLINEYKEPTEILKNKQTQLVDSLTGLETLIIKDDRLPNGSLELEAAYTSGGSSTLTQTYDGQIENLEYKTLRHPGHFKQILEHKEKGFFSEKQITHNGEKTTPRKTYEKELEKQITFKGPDMLILQIETKIKNKKHILTTIDFQNEKTNHTAMQRTTGYSLGIVAKMLAENKIKNYGVLKSEKDINPNLFINEWEHQGIYLNEKTKHT